MAEESGPTALEDLPVEVQARIDAVNEDHVKARFAGELNGITFLEEATQETMKPPDICTSGRVEAEATAEEIAQSELNFTPSYVPAGLEVVFEGGSTCQGEVIAVIRHYGGGSPFIVASHLMRDPVVVGDAPRERLREATINRYPAVIQEPVNPEGKYAIYLRQDDTFWQVWGQFIDADEVLRFMEGVLDAR